MGDYALRSIVPHPLEAVVFDMDGLLLDSERVYREAMRGAGGELGIGLDDTLFLRFVGNSWDAVNLMLIDHYGGDFPVADFRRCCDARYDVLCAAGLPLHRGVRRILEYLRDAGVPLALATSTPRPRARHHLETAGILHHFDAVVTRDDVIKPKPDPEPYLRATARLGVRPTQCIALEDSHNGVRAAAAAGLATIMIPDLLPPTDETARLCVATLATLDHVVDLLVEAAAQ